MSSTIQVLPIMPHEGLRVMELPGQPLQTSRRGLGTMQPQFEDDLIVTKPADAAFYAFAKKPVAAKRERQAKSSQKPKHTVRFDESANVSYENTAWSAEQARASWYTGRDILAFRRAYIDLLHTLRHLDNEAPRNPGAWAASLRRAYATFCEHSNDRGASHLVTALQRIPQNVFLLSALGTERAALRSVVTDSANRRQQIYARIASWQQPGIPNDMRVRGIRDVSRHLSRPCRLYARHVAEMAASGKSLYKARIV